MIKKRIIIMMINYLEKLKKTTNISDIIYKEITINKETITIVTIETITNSFNINQFILEKINQLKNTNLLYEYLLNNLPCISIKTVKEYNELLNYLLNGYTIIFVDNRILAIESINFPLRSISETDYEKTITGPKDSFIENFNTNVGLIRKRIKSIDLKLENFKIGKYSNTTIGIMYIEGICKKKLKDNILLKLHNIKIDGIIDSGSIKKYLTSGRSFFPTIKNTERPDVASQALLEGKIIIIVDNSPNILILPTFFIDYFHTSDDYYSKKINITFIRIIRLLAFIIAIILPAYYIAITTHNVDSIPIPLLVNILYQRSSVPFPSFIEALILIISFEILREGDARIPTNQGSAISILGGLVLGDAAVSAGIISPIMIIVIAISIISSLVFQSADVVNAIRWWRFIFIVLASILGLYGIFLGILLIIINLSDTDSINQDYLYPFAPINFNEQKDGFIRFEGKIQYRNPLLSQNHIRGKK